MKYWTSLLVIWIMAFCCVSVEAGKPPSSLTSNWPQTRGDSSFSGYSNSNLPAKLKFSRVISGLNGSPVKYGNYIYQSQPCGDAMSGWVAAFSFDNGDPKWENPVFQLTTERPAAEADIVFVASSDDMNDTVFQAFKSADGTRLWTSHPISATSMGGSGLTTPIGHEVAIPLPGVVAFTQVFDATNSFPIIFCSNPGRWFIAMDVSAGTWYGTGVCTQSGETRPVAYGGTGIFQIRNGGCDYGWPPNSVPSYGGTCQIDGCQSRYPVFLNYNISKCGGKTPVLCSSNSGTIYTADTSFSAGYLGCNYPNNLISDTPTAPLGDITAATSNSLLGIARDGVRLVSRDPASGNGAILWVSSSLGQIERNCFAVGGGGYIVVLNRTAKTITLLSESSGAVVKTGTIYLEPGESESTATVYEPVPTNISTDLTVTNDSILFGDTQGRVHVYDINNLQERQTLEIAKAPVIGELAVIGTEVLAAAADGTLVRLGTTGFECSARGSGYPQNGHQALGPGGVNTLTGQFMFSVQDLSIPFAGFSINLLRTYNSNAAASTSLFSGSGSTRVAGGEVSGNPFESCLGAGWTHSYQVAMSPQLDKATGSTLYVEERGDGRELGFTMTLTGEIKNPIGIMDGFTVRPAGYALSETTTGQGIALRKKTGLMRYFDPQGNLMLITDPNGNRLKFTYTSTGFYKVGAKGVRLIAITYVSSTMDQDPGMPKPVACVTVFLDYASGSAVLSKVRSPNPDGSGLVETVYQYDVNNLLKSVTGPGGSSAIYQSTYAYDVNKRMIEKKEPRAPAGEKWLKYQYYGDRVSEVRTGESGDPIAGYRYVPEYDGGQQTVVTRYTSAGETHTTYVYCKCQVLDEVRDAYGNITQYGWDPARNQTLVVDANHNRTEYSYDNHGNVLQAVDALGGSVFYDYEANYNQIMRKVDANGNETKFVYDGPGNLIASFQEMKAMPGESGTEYVTVYHYDGRGLRTYTRDTKGGETFYHYDGTGNMTATAQRLWPTPTTSTDYVTRFEYDAVGRRKVQVEPNGVRTEYVYDVENRLVKMKHGILLGSTPLTEISYEYDPMNRLLKETDATGRYTAYTYNDRDLVVTVKDYYNHTTTHEYDGMGNRIQTTDPNGNVTRYQYDLVGRLASVTEDRKSVV